MHTRKDRFIKKSSIVHKGKYDYSKVEYVDSETKVEIVCPIHGSFLQTPQSHARGNGCPLCSNNGRGRYKRMGLGEFVSRSVEVHGNKYGYSDVKYINSSTKVAIKCPIHGAFEMTPTNHLNGQGCPKCSGRGLTRDDVIELFNSVHHGKYDYSKVEYVRMHDKVRIVCPIHGEFLQTPSKHINGRGCPKCGKESTAEKRRLDKEELIDRCIEIFGDKYDYSEVEYKHTHKKVKVICNEHGPFMVRPYDLFHGHGCPKCSSSRLERGVRNALNDNGIEFVEQKRFKWLGRQSLDFYLPKQNIAIECQGEQHFKPISRFGGEEGYKVIVDRDERKRMLCSAKGIEIIYFSNIEGNGCITNIDELLKLVKSS